MFFVLFDVVSGVVLDVLNLIYSSRSRHPWGRNDAKSLVGGEIEKAVSHIIRVSTFVVGGLDILSGRRSLWKITPLKYLTNDDKFFEMWSSFGSALVTLSISNETGCTTKRVLLSLYNVIPPPSNISSVVLESLINYSWKVKTNLLFPKFHSFSQKPK